MKKSTARKAPGTALAHRPARPSAASLAAPAAARIEIVTPQAPEAAHLPAVPDEAPARGDLATMDPAAIYFGGTGLALAPFSAEAKKILLRKSRNEELDILPTGEVYLSAVHVRQRLWEAFGPGAWGQRPRSFPKEQGNTITQLWELVCLGRSVDTTWGEAEYQPDNARMTYPSALEAAKSNALTRNCKALGIGAECWDRKFCAKFIKAHCVKVHRREAKLSKWQWRRLDADPFYDEDAVDSSMPEATKRAWFDQMGARAQAAQEPRVEEIVISHEQASRLWQVMQSVNVSKEDLYGHLSRVFPYTKQTNGRVSAQLIRRKDYETICAWVEAFGKGRAK